MKRLNIIISLIIVFSFFLDSASITFAQRKSQNPLKFECQRNPKTGFGHGYHHQVLQAGCKERKIWGGLVPYGMAPGNKSSKEKPYPWRAGANENTTIEFNNDLLIDGNKLAAGKYGIHIIPSEKDWIVIFSNKNDLWGSYLYNKEDDALRVTVTPVKAPHQEWLMFGFEELAGTSATAFLHWEKLKVPINIKLAE